MTQLQARILISLVCVAVAILAVAALRATYFVTMPLVAAFFVATLVWPLQESLRKRLPARTEWLSIVISMMAVIVALGAFMVGAVMVVYRVASDRGDALIEDWAGRWEGIRAWMAQRGIGTAGEASNVDPMAVLTQWVGGTAASLLGLGAVLVLIVFFTLLMLIEARHWKRKSRTALPGPVAEEIMDAVVAITRQVRTFLLVQGFVALITAVVTALWLWALGVPYILLWSLLTFIVDFVPNIGPTVAGALISVVALMTLGWERALVTSVGILAIQQFFGHFVDPTLKGRHMSLSPLVVLLSVAFWAWVWGPAGAVLGVPITAALMVGGAHVPALRPLAFMLNRTEDQVAFESQTRGQGN